MTATNVDLRNLVLLLCGGFLARGPFFLTRCQDQTSETAWWKYTFFQNRFIQKHVRPNTHSSKILSWVLRRVGEGPKGGRPRRVGDPNPEKVGSSRMVGAKRVRDSQGGGPKFRVLPSPAPFSLFFLSGGRGGGVFSWNCGHRSRPLTTKIVRLGFSGIILCEARRLPKSNPAFGTTPF